MKGQSPNPAPTPPPALPRPLLSFLRRDSSWRNIRAFAALRPRFFRRAVTSSAILILTLIMLGRTLAIHGASDFFVFGVKDRWWCYVSLGAMRVCGEVSTYPSGIPPRHIGPAQMAAGPGWFYGHLEATGVTWSVSGGPPPTAVAHHCWLAGYVSFDRAGTYLGREYWLNLPFLPPLVGALSSLVLALWLRAYLRYLRRAEQHLCPTCAYDLRAHSPGQRCPECGTPIAAQEGHAP